MTTVGRIAVSFTLLAVVGSASVLWAQFGEVIAFDMASAAFLGCL